MHHFNYVSNSNFLHASKACHVCGVSHVQWSVSLLHSHRLKDRQTALLQSYPVRVPTYSTDIHNPNNKLATSCINVRCSNDC